MKTAPIILLSMLACCGCQRAASTFAPSLVPGASLSEAAFPAVWDAAKDVLRRHRFRLDETNQRAGSISTFPLGAPHFFEFWRYDSIGLPDLWEATVQHIRRRAGVEVTRDPAGAGCRVVVTVRKERFSTPERQINNSAAAVFFLSADLPKVATGRSAAAEDSYWYDLGRDPAQEDSLRKEIVNAAALSESGG